MYNSEMVSLHIDLNEDGVIGALASTVDNNVTFVGWAHQNFDVAIAPDEKIVQILEKVKSVGIPEFGKAVPKEKTKHITHVYVWVTAPDAIIQTKRVGVEEEKPFIIKEEHILKMKKEAGDAFKETNNGKIYQQVEEELSSISIDGYLTHNPIKKQAKHLSFTLYQCFIDVDYVKKVTDLIHKNFGNVTIEFKSRLKAVALAGYQSLNGEDDFMLVDISEKATEVIIVRKDGHIVSGHSLSGKETIIAEVSQNTNTTKDAAQSLLELYTQNTLDSSISEQVKMAFDMARRHWIENFSTLLQKLCEGDTIPHTILCLKGKLNPLFKSWIESDEFSKTFMSSDQKVIDLHENMFDNKVTWREDLGLEDSIKNKLTIEISSIGSNMK